MGCITTKDIRQLQKAKYNIVIYKPTPPIYIHKGTNRAQRRKAFIEGLKRIKESYKIMARKKKKEMGK